jgi:type IV secretory pathway VirB10-like protein
MSFFDYLRQRGQAPIQSAAKMPLVTGPLIVKGVMLVAIIGLVVAAAISTHKKGPGTLQVARAGAGGWNAIQTESPEALQDALNQARAAQAEQQRQQQQAQNGLLPGGQLTNPGSESAANLMAQAQALQAMQHRQEADNWASFGPDAGTSQASMPTAMPTQTDPYSAALAEVMRSMPHVAPAQVEQPPATKPDPAAKEQDQPGDPIQAVGKRYLIPQGTWLEGILVNRLDGEFPGPTEVRITNDVWSYDRKHVLIPSGTELIGYAHAVNHADQERLAVDFTGLLFPDWSGISLPKFAGLDQEGASALHDKVDRHLVSKVGTVLAVGLLGGLSESQSGTLLNGNGAQRLEGNVGQEAGLEGQMLLGTAMNRPNGITIREGTRIRVFVEANLHVPAYDAHRMDPDL